MFPRILLLLGIALLIGGAVAVTQSYLFVKRSHAVEAVALKSEQYHGPPRGPRTFPLALRFTDSNGTPIDAVANSPFSTKIEPGQRVPVLVDESTTPPTVKVALVSELWALPFAVVLAGVVLTVAGWAAGKVKR